MRHLSILGILLMILSGCSSGHDHDRAAIAVSFEPQAWMLSQIAGDDFKIITLLPPGSDPETFQPSISTMKDLGNAETFLTLGTDGFEKSLTETINSNFPDLDIIDCSMRIEKISGTHGSEYADHDHESDFDPHMLSSIRNCIIIADNMTRTLIEIHPEKKEKYQKAGTELKRRLQEMDDSISAMDLSGNSVAMRHPSLSYFARDYGLKQISLQENGKEVSPIQLKNRMEEIKGQGTKIFILEKEHATPGDEETAKQIGLNIVDVSLNSSSWLNDLMKIANEINRD